jgi:hypothetical protein
MITKTRPSEIEVKEERGLKKVSVHQVIIQTISTISALYAAHSIYIHIWRMMTGH